MNKSRLTSRIHMCTQMQLEANFHQAIRASFVLLQVGLHTKHVGIHFLTGPKNHPNEHG